MMMIHADRLIQEPYLRSDPRPRIVTIMDMAIIPGSLYIPNIPLLVGGCLTHILASESRQLSGLLLGLGCRV